MADSTNPPDAPTMQFPVRQKSANGQPPPYSRFDRTCHRCGASFVRLDGGAAERGIWDSNNPTYGMRWYCSVECAPKEVRRG